MFADEAVQIGLPLVSVVRRRHLRNLDAILVEDFKPAVIGDTLFVFSGRHVVMRVLDVLKPFLRGHLLSSRALFRQSRPCRTTYSEHIRHEASPPFGASCPIILLTPTR